MNHEYKKKYLKYKRKYLNLEISRIKGGNKQIGGNYIILGGLLIFIITALISTIICLGTRPNPETNKTDISTYITQLTEKDKENKELNEQLKNNIELNKGLEKKLEQAVQEAEKLEQAVQAEKLEAQRAATEAQMTRQEAQRAATEEEAKEVKKLLTSCKSTNTYIVPKEILTNKIEDIFTSMNFDNFDNFKNHFSNELSKIRTYQIIAAMGDFMMGIIKSNRHLVLVEIYNLKNLEDKLNQLRNAKPNDMKQELKKYNEIVTLFKKIEQIMTLDIESIIKKNNNTTLDRDIMTYIKKHMPYIIESLAQNNSNIEVIYDIFIKYINDDSVEINNETLKQIAYKIANTYVYKNLSLLNIFIESLINSDQVRFKNYIDEFKKDFKQLQQGHNTLTDRFLKGLLNIFGERRAWGAKIAHIFMGHLFVTKETIKRPRTAPLEGRTHDWRSQMASDNREIDVVLAEKGSIGPRVEYEPKTAPQKEPIFEGNRGLN